MLALVLPGEMVLVLDVGPAAAAAGFVDAALEGEERPVLIDGGRLGLAWPSTSNRSR